MSQPTTHHTMVNNSNPHWFVDFVASHHVISDLNNLSLCQGSEGTESTDDIFSGDGSALPINHLVLHAFPKTSLTFSFYLIFHVCLLYNKIWILFLNYVKLKNDLLNFSFFIFLFFYIFFQGSHHRDTSSTRPNIYEWPQFGSTAFTLLMLCLELRLL